MKLWEKKPDELRFPPRPGMSEVFLLFSKASWDMEKP